MRNHDGMTSRGECVGRPCKFAHSYVSPFSRETFTIDETTQVTVGGVTYGSEFFPFADEADYKAAALEGGKYAPLARSVASRIALLVADDIIKQSMEN